MKLGSQKLHLLLEIDRGMIMGRRTIAGHKINFHKSRKPELPESPADLCGNSLTAIFANWAQEMSDSGLLEAGNQTFLCVVSAYRYSNSVVVVKTMSGKAGEEGEVIDSSNNEVRLRLSPRDVPTSSTRAVLVCPPRGNTALWFSEYSARSSGASQLLTMFEKYWRSQNTGITMKKARLIAQEIALEDGLLTEVEVRLTRRADDRADGVDTATGTISHKFKPSKNNRLLGRLIDIFRDNPARAYELVEIEDIPEDRDAEIFVSVDIDGRHRKVQIFNQDDGVFFREELNDSTHPVLDDDQLVRFCSEESASFLERCNEEWDPAWAIRAE